MSGDVLTWAIIIGCYVFAALFFRLLGGLDSAGEAMTGRTLGKRLVRIRVVDDEGETIGLSAAIIRNLLRLVDGLFIYLVGAIFAWTSPLGQRLGDRAASTVVVRG